jgi:MFS family permease
MLARSDGFKTRSWTHVIHWYNGSLNRLCTSIMGGPISINRTSEDPKKRLFYGWVVVMVSALLGFLGTGFYSYSRGLFLPHLANTLDDGNRFSISMGFSCAVITGALIAPYLGKYLDYGSPRKVMLWGVTIVSASYLMLAQVSSLWQFYFVVSVCMGLGMATMGGQVWHRSVINWFDHWRGRAIAFAVMGASLSGIAMPPLVNAMIEAIDWRNAYLVFGATTALMLFPALYFFMRDRPEEIGEVRDGRSYVDANPEEMVTIEEDDVVWTTKGLLKHKGFWAISVIFGSMFCVFAAVMLHLFSHLRDIGLDGGQAAQVLSITALFAALGKPVIGWLSDFLGARVSIWLALLCQGAALLLFSAANTTIAAVLAGCLYGFGYSGMSPLRTFAISSTLGSRSFGAAAGLLRFVEMPWALLASPIAGLIYDQTGSYQIAFQVLAGLMLFCCLGPFYIAVGGRRERLRRKAAA